MTSGRTAFAWAALLSCVPTLVFAEATSPRTAVGPRACSTDMAFADPHDRNPGSGKGQIIAGWSGLGLAAASAAQLPFCHRNTYDDAGGEPRCVRVSIAVGLSSLVLGLPILVWGYRKRAAQRAWRARHGLETLALPLEVRASTDGAWIGYRALLF